MPAYKRQRPSFHYKKTVLARDYLIYRVDCYGVLRGVQNNFNRFK